MDVPYQTAIIDTNTNTNANANAKFTTQTISGYKRTEVTTAFEKAIKNGRMEEACTWMVELNASGIDLWRIFLKIALNDINIANPYLPQFLKEHYKVYNYLQTLVKKGKQIELRNNQRMRNLLVDITITLTMSNHTTKLLPIALPKLTEADLIDKNYKNRIKAFDLNSVSNFLYKTDPSEVKIALNEITYLLITQDHTITSNSIIYWLLWLHKMDANLRKQRSPLVSHPVKVKNISPKHQKEWVWILWKILLAITKHKKIPQLSVQINALFYLYKQNFTPVSKQQKIPILMTAILYLHETIDWNLPLYNSYKLRVKACGGINILYNLLVQKLQPQYTTDITTKTLYNNIKKDVFHHPTQTSHQSQQYLTENEKDKPKTKKELKAEKALEEQNKLDEKMKYLNIVPHKPFVASSVHIPPPPEVTPIDEIKRLII